MRRTVPLAALGLALLTASPRPAGTAGRDPGPLLSRADESAVLATQTTVRTCTGRVAAVSGRGISVQGFIGRPRQAILVPSGRKVLAIQAIWHAAEVRSDGRRVPVVSVKPTRDTVAFTTPDGAVTTITWADQPVRHYQASPQLAAGEAGRTDHFLAAVHRLADVRVGDVVQADTCRIGDFWECQAVLIKRRPGGRVPPAYGLDGEQHPRYHEHVNAHQDWEERRTPMPNHFAPSYRHQGAVTALDAHTITVKHPDRAPKRFALSPALAAGQGPVDPGNGSPVRIASFTYRAGDVRLGDHVTVSFGRADGVDICDSICIRRRPGGRVPPARGEERDVYRHHEHMNALQDREEKGISLPPKYAGHDSKPFDETVGPDQEIIPRELWAVPPAVPLPAGPLAAAGR